MRRLILVFILCTNFSVYIFAQTSSLRIKDIFYIPHFNIGRFHSYDSLNLQVQFLLDSASNASQLILCIGSENGRCDIDSIIGTYIIKDSHYYIEHNGIFDKINYHSNIINIPTSKQVLDRIKYLSVFVIDKKGLKTEVLSRIKK